MLFAKLRRLFYWSVKESYEQYGSRYLRLRYTLELLLFLYCFARTVLLICGFLFKERLASFLDLDYLSPFFTSTGGSTVNEQTIFMLSMVVVFTFLAKSNTYEAGAPGNCCLTKFYLYIVLNTESFTEATFSRRKVTRIKRQLYLALFSKHSNRTLWRLCPHLLSLFCYVKVAAQMEMGLKHIDLKAVEGRKLPPLFDLSLPLRIKLYWVVRLAEAFAYGFGVLCYSLVILLSFFILSHYRALILTNWLYLPWILADCLCVLYQFITLYQTGFFYAFLCFFPTPLLSNVMRDDLRRLVSVRGKPATEQATIWQYFLKDHHQMVIEILHGNTELWDRTMTIFLLTNLAPNILLWTKLSFDHLSPMESTLFWTFVLGQSFATVNSLLPVAEISRILHRPVGKLVAVQGALGRPLLAYKLKLDDLFMRLTHGAKYGVTVKPLGTITYHNLAEGLFCYVAFLLYSFTYCGSELAA